MNKKLLELLKECIGAYTTHNLNYPIMFDETDKILKIYFLPNSINLPMGTIMVSHWLTIAAQIYKMPFEPEKFWWATTHTDNTLYIYK